MHASSAQIVETAQSEVPAALTSVSDVTTAFVESHDELIGAHADQLTVFGEGELRRSNPGPQCIHCGQSLRPIVAAAASSSAACPPPAVLDDSGTAAVTTFPSLPRRHLQTQLPSLPSVLTS